MTSAERDAIRAFALDKLRVCSGSECSVECRAYRAILCYVPAGDVTAPAGFTLQPVAATADTPASVVTEQITDDQLTAWRAVAARVDQLEAAIARIVTCPPEDEHGAMAAARALVGEARVEELAAQVAP